MNDPAARPTPSWALALAFGLVYLAWGTTYLAMKVGVQVFPPLLFGGVRIMLAGLVLAGYLAVRRASFHMPRRELIGTAFSSILLFLGGNGLITIGQKTVESGVAAILVSTTPLWMALLETLYPWGDRLRLLGWLGLLLGLAGVAVLLVPKLGQPATLLADAGPLLVIGSAICWAAGSIVFRYQQRTSPHLTAAAYQMIIGGGTMTVLGLAFGEWRQLSWERLTFPAVYAFFHLLVVGSLIGFLAYTWLLGRVSATLAGTYAYVNPVVALFVGRLIGDELITWPMIGGLVVILTGVALVRASGVHASGARGLETGVRGQATFFPKEKSEGRE